MNGLHTRNELREASLYPQSAIERWQAELARERESHNLTRWYMAIGFAVLVGIVVWQALKIRGCA